MKPAIAFVSQLLDKDQARWILLLQSLMPAEVIKPFEQLTVNEKQRCEIAIVANPNVKHLRALENLQWVQSLWAGVEKLVIELTKPSFKLSRLIDPNLAETMSEAVLSWVLYLHRDMPKYLKQQQDRRWLQHQYCLPSDRTIGVLGLGELGTTSAVRLKNNGFNVIGWSNSGKTIAGVSCYFGAEGLAKVAKESDIIVCLLPLTLATKKLLNAPFFELMPAGASIINFARGSIIDHQHLVEALDTNKLEHAVLDVFECEPLNENSELWQHESITVLPHISAPTHFQSAANIVAKNIVHYRATKKIPECVDFTKGY